MKQTVMIPITILLFASVFAVIGWIGTVAILTPGNDGDSTQTESPSGLEVISGDVTILRGCSDNQIVKWDETEDDWNCENDSTGAGGGVDKLEEDNVQVGDADIATLDFGSGFDITESPDTEINVTLDTTELGDITFGSGSDITHTFNASGATDSVFSFGNGTINVSTGEIQEGGNAVVTVGDTDVITTGLLDDAADTPLAGECLLVATATTQVEYATCPGGGSGDNVTVNSTATDTTANFLDGDIDFTLVDGGAGGPDDVTATVGCTACIDVTDMAANSVDGSELVDDSVDTTELDDVEAPGTGQLVATDNATATQIEYIAVGTGLTHDGDTLSADLGTAITSSEITDNEILEADLKAVDAAVDEECLTYEATGGDFEWQTCGGSGANSFETHNVPAGTDPVAESSSDTLNWTSTGSTITLTGDSGTDTINVEAVDVTCTGCLGTTEIAALDVSDDINLTCGTNCTLTGDEISVDDAFVSNAGDAITGDLDYNDGVTDSPKATFTPATGTAWDIYTEDTGDDLQLEATTASTETIDIVNTGAGVVDLNVDGTITGTTAVSGPNVTSGANPGHTHTTTSISGIDVSDDVNLTAGRSLTLTGDDVAADVELYTDTKGIWFEDPVAADDFKSIWTANGFAATITKIWCESDQTVNMDLQVDDGTPADVNGTDLVCDATPAEDEAMGGDATLADGDRLDLAITSVSGTPTWVSIMWTFTYDD